MNPATRKWRRRSLAEKRQLVELTLRDGSSVASVARTHGVSRHQLAQWRSLHEAGQLESADSKGSSAAAFLPVKVVSEIKTPPRKRLDMVVACAVVEVSFPSGVKLRLETGDGALLRSIVSELAP